MKRIIYIVAFIVVVVSARALLLNRFSTYNDLIAGSPDIIIAQCVATEDSIKPQPLKLFGNVISSDINVITILKGRANKGLSHLVSISETHRGQFFLVFGSLEFAGTNSYFSANEPYRTIPLNRYFDLARLSGKSLNDQLDVIFKSRLTDLDQEIAKDNLEKARLVHWFSPENTPWPDNPMSGSNVNRSGAVKF